MKDNYGTNELSMRNDRDSMKAKVEHNRQEAEHSSKDMFVKKQQNEMKSMEGRAPMLKGVAMEYDAYMCNNGEHAQEFARELTAGLDKKAFPVR